MCASGQYLVVTFHLGYAPTTIGLYRLPDLTLRQDLNYSTVWIPCCDSNRRVYVPARYMVTELEITETGDLSVLRNITWTLAEQERISAVGLGPQTGQLCIGVVNWQLNMPVVYIINLANGNITTMITVPNHSGGFPTTISCLSSGQILLTSLHKSYRYCMVSLYQTISQQPQILGTSTWQYEIMAVANRENFLVTDAFPGAIHVLDKQGRVVHIIEYQFVFGSPRLAVWQDSILVSNFFGDLVWLSPV